MSRDINPFGLRMPQELRAALEEAAATAGRSLNSEIVWRLQESIELDEDSPVVDNEYLAMGRELREQIDWLKEFRDNIEKEIDRRAVDRAKPAQVVGKKAVPR